MVVFTIFIAGLVGVGCLIIALIKHNDEESPIVPLIISGICLISVVATIFHLNHISNETTWNETWETKIVALKDNSNIQGQLNGGIFVISGYINESMYYYCMESTKEGKHMLKIPSDNTYIVETDEKEPSVVKKTEKYTDERYTFWLSVRENEKYIIYVPKGTVDTTYKVDME